MKKKLILALILLPILGIVFFFSSLYAQFKDAEKKIFIPNPAKPVLASTNSIQEHFKNNTPFNILLLGYGGGNHDGTYLTDSMMVVHVDPAQKAVSLISLPRDMWVKIPTSTDDGTYWKINQAYAIGVDPTEYPNRADKYKGPAGGGNLAKDMVQTVTGLPIDYFVALDFNGFKNTIDTLGGVDVNVETTFDDYEYPIEGKENDLCGHPASDLPMLEVEATQSAAEVVFPCRYMHLHFQKGMTHMDGTTALEYVRSRHSLQDGTDFGRSKRQRNLLVAVKAKIFSIGFIPKILSFVSSLKDDMTTDLSPDEAQALIGEANTLNKYQINNLALTNQNVLKDSTSDDGQAILIPKDGIDQWEPIHNWIQLNLSHNQALVLPTIQVENATTISGLATLASNHLQDLGFTVLPPTNANGRNLTTTSITVFSNRIDPTVLSKIEKEFQVTSVKSDFNGNSNYDILIEVGQDYNQLQGKKLIN